MKYEVRVKYAIWHQSIWEVEAIDEAAAGKMITDAFTEGSDFVESTACHRTGPDAEHSGPFEEIEKITKLEKTEVA